MDNNLARKITAFAGWRQRLAAAISDFQSWLEQHEHTDGEQDLRTYELIESLRSNKLVIALVAEFSRGKTELLNAILFSDFKDRVLPSSAGRTTMCPTELKYDESDGPCIKLLPIETRKSSLTISEYKSTPVHWSKLDILKVNSLDDIRETLNEITKTKLVNKREAHELGLYNPDGNNDGLGITEKGMVEVPVWRHAIINYPHPLLKQDLVILDTPGLNAIGSEPELSLKMIPEAHAIIFLLAADLGISKSDLELWRNHIYPYRNSKNNNTFIILNKVDALWDKLQNKSSIKNTIDKQINETSARLHVDKDRIFPISAQKALIGKIKGDDTLIQDSGLIILEDMLAEEIIPSRHEYIQNKIIYEISGRIESSLSILDNKLDSINKQLSELKTLGGKNLDAIQKMVKQMRNEKEKYDHELKGFMHTRDVITAYAKTLLDNLSVNSFKMLIKKTRREMHESWTTAGLKKGMRTLFDGIMSRMDQVNQQSEVIMNKVDEIYKRLHTEFGLPKTDPASLLLSSYYIELKRLEAEAEAFRKSPVTAMTEQHYVIKKFFITLVSQAHNIFNRCNESVKNWYQVVMNTVFAQIQAHKERIDKNLEDIKKIHNNLDNLGIRINELEYEKKELEEQKEMLNNLLKRLHDPLN